MANREPISWITVHGVHVPIFEGETKEDAFKRRMKSLADKNSDEKESQIQKNKAEAEKLNKEAQQPPRRLQLPNVSADVANKSSDVYLLGKDLDSVDYRGRRRFRFKSGTEIRNVLVFAGAGTSKEFRDAAKYAQRYGGKAEEWQHCSGDAIITNGRVTLHREVHWVQGKDGKIREAFIKVRHDGG